MVVNMKNWTFLDWDICCWFLAIGISLFIIGCSDSVSGPYNQTYGLKYDKLFDQPTSPPNRPPLPCGWYVLNDSTWGYDVHADTCN